MLFVSEAVDFFFPISASGIGREMIIITAHFFYFIEEREP